MVELQGTLAEPHTLWLKACVPFARDMNLSIRLTGSPLPVPYSCYRGESLHLVRLPTYQHQRKPAAEGCACIDLELRRELPLPYLATDIRVRAHKSSDSFSCNQMQNSVQFW
jgi:hypothetical protein